MGIRTRKRRFRRKAYKRPTIIRKRMVGVMRATGPMSERAPVYSVTIRKPGIPDSINCKLVYTSRIAMSSVSGLTNSHFMRGNSAFDPDYTISGGRSAYHFNEFSGMYGYYRVYASSIKFTPITVNSDTNRNKSSMQLTITPVLNITPAIYGSDMDVIRQYPYCKERFIDTHSSNMKPLTNFCTTATVFGVKKRVVQDEQNFSATFVNNPENQWFWAISTKSADQTTTCTIAGYVKVVYYIKFFSQWNHIAGSQVQPQAYIDGQTGSDQIFSGDTGYVDELPHPSYTQTLYHVEGVDRADSPD